MKRTLVQIASIITLVTLAHATEFHVATTGNDANPGTLSQPFASPVRARNAIRAAKQQGDPGPFTVELRGGTYTLSETLTFTPEDSGTATAPVVWRSHPGEHAVISGGSVVHGFQENVVAGLRRWTVVLPEVKAGQQYFRQLFVSVDSQPYQRRYRPQLGMNRVDGITDSPRRKAAAHRAAQPDFYFAPGDFKAWENLSDVEVAVLHVWSSSRLLVQQVDIPKGIVTFTGLPAFAVDQGGLQPYFIENVKEELKSPGQWYLDRPTGLLTYLPCAGETLSNTAVVVPRLANIMTFAGDYKQGRFVSHIECRDLVFAHNESALPHEGYGGSQGQADLPAAIEMTGTKGCSLVRCCVSQTGNYGIGIGLGCHENRIVGCRLFDLGGGGIKVGDQHMNAQAAYPELPTDNRIENCAISDGGIIYFSANAIWCGIVRGTQLRHNAIWNFPYSGIAMGWSWSDTPTGCASNRIEFNSISNVVALLADGASIYTLGRQPGTVIRGNVVRDNPKSPFAGHHWQLGLYLDEGSSEMLVENNFVYAVGTHGFNINGGAQNIIQNNIFGPVHGTEEPFIRCYKRPYAHGNLFTRNLSYSTSENLADAVWDKALCDCRSNLYWNCAGYPLKFLTKSFADWQALGQDAGSLNVDPLFEDPAHGNFRLKSSSPAFTLGFKAFDIAEAGVEPEFRDITAPATVTPPPFYAMQPPGPKAFTGFAIDFDQIAIGKLPRGWSCTGGRPEATFQVSAEGGSNGHHTLAATTRTHAVKPFHPYLTYKLPQHLDKGTVVFSCDVKQKADAATNLCIEFRDYSKQGNKTKEFTSLPGVTFSADGSIKISQQTLASAATGTWTHLEITFPLTGDSREALVTITLADGTKKLAKIPLNPEFVAVSVLGLYCSDAVEGACYINHLRMAISN